MGSLKEEHKISNEDEEYARIQQMKGGMVLPMVLKTAIELDLFEIMAKVSATNPTTQFSFYDLVSNLPTQNPEAPAMIERILRFLASQSLLSSTVFTDECGNSKNLYGMAPICKHFVRNQDRTSLASSFLLPNDKVFVDCWYHLKDAVLEGGMPFNKAHGMNAFEYPAVDKRFNQVFNNAMHDNTRITMKMIVEKYKGFEGVKELVDVGGGLGATLGIIISKYPNIKGINFDLPHVIKDATPCPGVEHVGGDMFQNVPKGDVIFLKWILHDWGDDYCIKILKKCWEALPERGKVVVVESIIPDPEQQPIDSVVSQTVISSDIRMLVFNPGGKERTKKEYDALAREAGFASSEIVCCVSLWHLKDAVLEGGIPFNKAYGVNVFEYQEIDKKYSKIFNNCMDENTRIIMNMILEKYNGFEGAKELVDVGGGLGATLGIILSKYPHIKGINFDLPYVIKDAPPLQGVEHVGGDMFHSVPKGDVIFMKSILHNWSDDHCVELLNKCWMALEEGGKVVVLESIIFDQQPTDVISQTSTSLDMAMLAFTSGGKERTEKEYKALANKAGFASSKLVCSAGAYSIIEFYKKT